MGIAIKSEKKWFSTHIPELHISTEGETLDEVIKNMQEAIELHYDEEKSYNKILLSRNNHSAF